jgi:hypothetical protein
MMGLTGQDEATANTVAGPLRLGVMAVPATEVAKPHCGLSASR